MSQSLHVPPPRHCFTERRCWTSAQVVGQESFDQSVYMSVEGVLLDLSRHGNRSLKSLGGDLCFLSLSLQAASRMRYGHSITVCRSRGCGAGRGHRVLQHCELRARLISPCWLPFMCEALSSGHAGVRSLRALHSFVASPVEPLLNTIQDSSRKNMERSRFRSFSQLKREATEIARRNGFGEVITYVQGKVRWVATGGLQGCPGDATS